MFVGLQSHELYIYLKKPWFLESRLPHSTWLRNWSTWAH